MVALCVLVLGFSLDAKAERYSLSALGFQVLDCTDPGRYVFGLRGVACGSLFVAWGFKHRERLCKFGIKYFDGDPTKDIVATLERRRITTGTPLSTQPTVMATVKSTGLNSNLQSKETANIRFPVVDTNNFAYFTKIRVPANASALPAAAVVDTAAFATCP
jgi:hypothetical protein